MEIFEVPVKGVLVSPRTGACVMLPVEASRMEGWPSGFTLTPTRPHGQSWQGAEFFPAAPEYRPGPDGVMEAVGSPLAGVLLVHSETEVVVDFGDGTSRRLGPGRYVLGVPPVFEDAHDVPELAAAAARPGPGPIP
jgi:hypothetical protein